ncbi:MAG TPA: acyltransferase [Thermoanaerobaculia bacterium]|nr:acyltransferase [Thermoanaerobaculia bacterium]
MSVLLTLFRSLRLLRHPALVRRLGELWRDELLIEEIRRRNPDARIHSGVLVDGWGKGTLELSAGAQVEHGTMIALGSEGNGYGALRIGPRTWIGPYNNFRLGGGATIEVGADCLISQFCSIVAANHSTARGVIMRDAPLARERMHVTIGDDVWLGASSTILPGVTIGDGAVIGANSVVIRDVPPYEIHAGNPARRVGERS